MWDFVSHYGSSRFSIFGGDVVTRRAPPPPPTNNHDGIDEVDHVNTWDSVSQSGSRSRMFSSSPTLESGPLDSSVDDGPLD